MSSNTKPILKIANETINKKVLQKIRSQVIEIQKSTEHSQTQSIPNEPVSSLMHEGEIIEPPFDLLTLAILTEYNSELNQNLEAMEVNIEGFGYRFVPRVKNNADLPDKLKKDVKKEYTYLTNFFNYCTHESFIKFRRKLRKDLESTGCAYFEVIRNSFGKIQAFTHLPAYQMRLSRTEDESIETIRPILELQEDGSVKISKLREWKRFRRYIQTKQIHRRTLNAVSGFETVWFKEFGDPRTYNAKTGEVDITGNLPISKQANEVIYLNLYCARSPYGLPRYIGNLLSIYGDRASEEINFTTFSNNNIPSMVLAVSNGQLTEGTIQRIQSFVDSQIQGSGNFSKFLIIEAEGLEEGEDGGHTKIDIKPLVSEQHKDALFQNYSANNQDKIRRAFRLPPIYVGRSDDYTRATAESSRMLADEQVFAPERDEFDSIINRIIFPDMGIIYHKFKTNSPNTTDNSQLVKILAGSEKTGGMTPAIARTLLEDILGQELPDFPDDFQKDLPFSLTMAEAVKNKADVSEPGQQVTALKNIQKELEEPKILECTECGNVEIIDETNKLYDPLVDHLLLLNKKLEKKWLSEVNKLKDSDD